MNKNDKTKSRFMKRVHVIKKVATGRLQVLLALGIVIVGVLIALVFIKLRRQPKRKEQDTPAPLVNVEQLNIQDIQMVIRGYGTVSPKVQVEIVPEVPGKIVSVHPQFKAGGLIHAKEQILQIDPRDYDLAVPQANAAVAEAQVRLDTETAEAQAAREEWEQLHPNTEPSSALVSREPQMRRAEAALESAKAQLETAKLRLERTSLSLPFDALIISERVDLGQYVVVGQSLGVAYGIESVEIEVPLEDEELAWFDIFGNPVPLNGNETSIKYTTAQVKADFAGSEHIWKGRVIRTTGQVDKISRMVSVVVEVPKPFDTSNGRPPLLPGVFAEVIIEGNILRNAVAVHRDAIRQGNKVWLVNDGRLHIQTLEVVRFDKDFAYVISGIEDNAIIVVSSLDVVTEGMKVRTSSDEVTEGSKESADSNEPAEMEAN
jgi:RND family efflux transporter MFP subunit